MMFKTITIDTEKNWLLCSTDLVGLGEIAEIWTSDKDSPPQATGRHLQKIKDPNIFIVYESFDNHDIVGTKYAIGANCVLRVLMRNLSGSRKRKFSSDEKKIVNMVREEGTKDIKVSRAKTGSVRQKKKGSVTKKKK